MGAEMKLFYFASHAWSTTIKIVTKISSENKQVVDLDAA